MKRQAFNSSYGCLKGQLGSLSGSVTLSTCPETFNHAIGFAWKLPDQTGTGQVAVTLSMMGGGGNNNGAEEEEGCLVESNGDSKVSWLLEGAETWTRS